MTILWTAQRRFHRITCEAELAGPPYHLVLKDGQGSVVRDSTFDQEPGLRSSAASWSELVLAHGFSLLELTSS